jgi:hypothetical protein
MIWRIEREIAGMGGIATAMMTTRPSIFFLTTANHVVELRSSVVNVANGCLLAADNG